MHGFGSSFKILTAMPTPSSETFAQGLTATVGSDGKDYSVILFSPNLHLVGSLDNTNSESSSSYSTSVSHGFTFSSTQGLSIEESVGVNIEIVTASVKTTFSLSFTEEWSTTKTKTVSIDCPAGKKSFIYQGIIESRIMAFDSTTAKYSWYTPTGKAMTDVLVTRDEPILDNSATPPSVPVTYNG